MAMAAAAEGELDLRLPSCLHLVSAFLAMESPHVLISLARDCGGGSVTDRVQRFIWDYCISKADGKFYVPYLKSFLKKIIVEVESQGFEVLDELYEQLAFYMTSLKDDDSAKENSRVLKCISFLFPDDCRELPSCPETRKLVVTLQCSLNMLEGDTGCSIWPSSLLLSEFILSCPEMFSSKSCFEDTTTSLVLWDFLGPPGAWKSEALVHFFIKIGSGVGLVGICLAHVKASEVMLSDGDLSSLENMKLNLELNQLSTRVGTSERPSEDLKVVNCIHLPWESATDSELQDLMPDIILGADVIYDPLCLPHLVKVLAFLLSRGKLLSHLYNRSCNGFLLSSAQKNGAKNSSDSDTLDKAMPNDSPTVEYASKKGPLAFIASVIRNIDTFNRFLALADQANLSVEDVTEKFVPFNLLPYLQSYPRSSVRLLTIMHL